MNKTEARERLERLLAVVDELPEEAEIMTMEGNYPTDKGSEPAIFLFEGFEALCKAKKVRARREQSKHNDQLVYHNIYLYGVCVSKIVRKEQKDRPR